VNAVYFAGFSVSSPDFSLELTYNYGVESYELGNDLAGIHVCVAGAAERARSKGLRVIPAEEAGVQKVQNPDGQWLVTQGNNNSDGKPSANIGFEIHLCSFQLPAGSISMIPLLLLLTIRSFTFL
jgi:hypothetical protein